MRLINLKTLVVDEFIESDRPPYVILSHTWGADEVSFQMLQTGGVEALAGYEKIKRFCRQGAENGFEWGWVDTCCIDKTSSAELSEAINSMYRWYQEADVCYAYLADVRPHLQSYLQGDEFAKSRWFTRGWTLQELLAPSAVVFYLNDWTEYGTKTSLQFKISRITGIPERALLHETKKFCIAEKMSWVASRRTTRIEDMSYCLLGIFGVNIPLIYGEGARAFVRLQEEIMKREVDLSIFAWPSSAIPEGPGLPAYIPLLAPYPAVFMSCGGLNYEPKPDLHCGPYTSTNKGLLIQNLPVVEDSKAREKLTSAGFRGSKTHSRAEEDPEDPILAFLCAYATDEDAPAEFINAVTSFGLTLTKNSDGIYCRHRKPESLLEVLPKLGLSSVAKTCYLHIWFDSSWYTETLTHTQRTRKFLIRGSAYRLSNFSISEACVNGPWVYNGKPGFYLRELEVPKSYDSDIEPPSRPGGFTFSNTSTKERFSVILGRRKSETWVEILEHGDLQNLVAEYTAEEEMAYSQSWCSRYGSPDRASKTLSGGKKVFVSIVHGLEEGERVFFLDISVRDE
jgi:hypothetical protein